jgi:hypothetical protein
VAEALLGIVLACHVYGQRTGTRGIISSDWGCASKPLSTGEACCCITGLRLATVSDLEDVSACRQHELQGKHPKVADGDV